MLVTIIVVVGVLLEEVGYEEEEKNFGHYRNLIICLLLVGRGKVLILCKK